MDQAPSLIMDPTLAPSPVRAALVWGFGMAGCPATVVPADFLEDVLQRVHAAGPDFVSPARKAAVRQMLRFGSYKPAGRSKPSSEYLLAAAMSDDFPLVNGPVDVNNAVSLEWSYPASIFDAGRTGLQCLLRRGRPGERYPFNASGQVIDLEDLLCVCCLRDGEWAPCGNPVKDSMTTKVSTATTAVVAVLFAPSEEGETDLRNAAERYCALLSRHCGAIETGFSTVDR